MRIRLNAFMKMNGQKYYVIRNGEKQSDLIGGLLHPEKKYIGFYPDADVRVGDWVEHSKTGERLYIHDTSNHYIGNQTFQKKGLYWTEAQYQRRNEKNGTSNPSFTFNGPVTGSIVGTQQHATLTVQIENLYQDVEKRGGEDTEELKKMLDKIQKALDKGELKKGSLSQFGDLLAKHSWIMGPLGTLLVNHLLGS